MRIFFVFLCFFFFHIGFSQGQSNPQFDSLFNKAIQLYEDMQPDSTLFYVGELNIHVNQRGVENIETSTIHRIYYMEGRSLSLNRQYDKSNAVWKLYLASLASRHPTKYNEQLEILNQIALNYTYKGSPNEMKKAIEAIDSSLRPNVIYSFSNLAQLAHIRGQYFSFSSNFSQGLEHLELALCLHRLTSDTLSAEMISCISEMSNFYAYMGNAREAINMSLYAQEKAGQAYGKNSFKAKKYSNNIGLDFYQLQEYEKAEHFLNDYVQAMKNQYGDDHISLIPSYINLGLLNAQRKISSALNYFHAAERLYFINNISDQKNQGPLYINLAVLYLQVGDQKKGLEYIEKLEELSKTAAAQFTDFHILALQLRGEALLDDGQVKVALESYILVEQLYIKKPPPDKLRIVENYSAIARAYYWLGDYAKSTQYFESALQLTKELDRPTRVIRSTIKQHSALIAMKGGNWEAALELNKEALNLIYADIDNDDFENVNKFSHLIHLLEDRLIIETDYLAASPERNIQFLHQSFNSGKNAILQCINYMSAEEDKVEIRKLVFSLSERLLNTALLIQNNDATSNTHNEALEILEINKNIALLVDIRSNELFDELNMPDIIIKEHAFRKAISDLRIQIQSTHNTATQNLSHLRDTILKVNNQHQDILKTIAQQDTSLYQMLYSLNLANLHDIQSQLLSRQDVLFQYFMGDSLIYRLTITRDASYFSCISTSKQFTDLVTSWLELANNPRTNSKEYAMISCNLSVILLDKKLMSNGQFTNLIIINDGIGNYLPFESLPYNCDAANFVNDVFNVSYSMSSTLALARSENSSDKSHSFFGFAASYDLGLPTTNFLVSMRSAEGVKYNLPFAIDEVQSIATFLKGNAFLNESATESNFKRVASEAAIIHLSLHGETSDRFPMESGLLFHNIDSVNDGILTAAEIYGLDLKAEMAVLSACETGVGELKRGEGLQSIARAFAFAGVNSTVMSLWKVPDYSTKKIMVEFYKGLKSGLRKDEALRFAKLHYLENTTEPDERLPYYWAGFILQGSTDPIQFNSFDTKCLLYSLLILLGGFVFLFYFKQRRMFNFSAF